jgi:DNA repair exonuclease SbcCD nuclease subunit
MRLLIFADLQAHDGDERCFNLPATSLQLYRVRRFFADLSRIYEEQQCDGLIDLGDTTDDRSAIPVPVIHEVMRGIEPFTSSQFVYKLIGNHEQYLRDTSIDSGQMYRHVFAVVNQHHVIEEDDRVYVFASYPENHEELTKWLDQVGRKYRGKKTVLFGHFQAVGAMMNSGEALLGVPRDVLERFSLVLLGHIHLPQTIGSKIHYVGSPFQQNWGESNQGKRVGILDTDTLTLEWVPLEGYPTYRTATLQEFLKLYDPVSEDRWKVVLKTHAESESFFTLPHSNRAEAVYGYTVNENTSTEETAEVRDWSFEASLRHWARTAPLPAGIELPEEELVAIGHQLATG